MYLLQLAKPISEAIKKRKMLNTTTLSSRFAYFSTIHQPKRYTVIIIISQSNSWKHLVQQIVMCLWTVIWMKENILSMLKWPGIRRLTES